MKKIEGVKFYPPIEEKINVYSHATGLILSIFASVFLLKHALSFGTVFHVISFSAFGVGLILLYTASTLYHSSKKPKLRSRLRVFDHASIYILIAGTYTPFALITLRGPVGWAIFGCSWGLGISGVILKLYFTGRYKVFSTLMYVFMGWIIVFAIKPLINSLSSEGMFWLFAGGAAYTTGAILYCIKKLKFNHAIFHVLVLIGSACHFVSIYFYVLPV